MKRSLSECGGRAAAWTAATVVAALLNFPAYAADCFLLQPLRGGKVYAVGGDECARKTAPASTFKIPHALIALETGVVTDPHALVQWDGKEQDFDAWERDHSLHSSMGSSVYPFYQRTATRIGRERMAAQLKALRYGSDTFDGELTTFWTNGDFVISPREQLDFLRRLFAYEVGARRNVDVVKASLLMPKGKITNAAGVHDFAVKRATRVWAKTGNTRVNGERVSWLVGVVEAKGKPYVFVARRTTTGARGTTGGAQLALRHLNDRLR